MNLHEIIAFQQKGHENEPIFMIGEQLKDIVSREPGIREILERDLLVDGMDLAGAASYFKKYADKNRKNAKCFCISPHVAEKLLREFYGLPDCAIESKKETAPVKTSGFIDLNSFF